MLLNFRLAFLGFVAVALTGRLTASSEIEDYFKEVKVVPNIVENPPREFLEIKFPNGIEPHKGLFVTPTQGKDAPDVCWTAQSDSYYLLLFTCIDGAAVKTSWTENLHWLVVNIPGKQLDQGTALAEYWGPTPPNGTGRLRFVIWIFEQPGGRLQFDEKPITNRTIAGRTKFSTKQFINKYKLGAPLAGNVFLSEWEKYVDDVLKEMDYEANK